MNGKALNHYNENASVPVTFTGMLFRGRDHYKTTEIHFEWPPSPKMKHFYPYDSDHLQDGTAPIHKAARGRYLFEDYVNRMQWLLDIN